MRIRAPRRSAIGRLLALAAVVACLAPSVARAQRVLVVVRHAEKVDESLDPPLSEVGRARAERLAELLRDAGLTAIYTSELQRTAQTAEPLARRLGLSIVKTDGRQASRVVARIRKEQPEGRVLLVGHSTTIPEILQAATGKRGSEIADDEYDNLWIVTRGARGGTHVLRMHF